MASTNKTTNYNLSQYIGTDKPTYLGDYNSDMEKIDTQMKTNADNVALAINQAESATQTANNANNTAGQANNTAGQANNTANSANQTATNAQQTANSALSTATNAQQTANNAITNIEKFNLTSFTQYTNDDITVTNGTKDTCALNVARNPDGSIFKLYGRVAIRKSTSADSVITINTDTGVKPESAINIVGGGLLQDSNKTIWNVTLRVNTDGTISFTLPNIGTSGLFVIFLFPCLYFAKDFQDTPID